MGYKCISTLESSYFARGLKCVVVWFPYKSITKTFYKINFLDSCIIKLQLRIHLRSNGFSILTLNACMIF